MFEPGQFEVNEAWIVFRLNDAPISTGADGDFNVVCLMDAGSCYMLGNEFVPAHLAGLSESSAERLIEAGRSQGQMLPQKFLLSTALEPDQFSNLAKRLGVEVSRVPDEQVSPLISEARAVFRGTLAEARSSEIEQGAAADRRKHLARFGFSPHSLRPIRRQMSFDVTEHEHDATIRSSTELRAMA